MSDPAEYRTREELENFKQRDPINYMADILIDEGIIGESDTDSIQQEMEDRVQEALDFAEESPEPDREELYEDVYEDYPRDLRDKQ